MKLELDPTLTSAATALLTTAFVYVTLRTLDMAAHLFVLIRNTFKQDEDMRTFMKMLQENVKEASEHNEDKR